MLQNGFAKFVLVIMILQEKKINSSKMVPLTGLLMDQTSYQVLEPAF